MNELINYNELNIEELKKIEEEVRSVRINKLELGQKALARDVTQLNEKLEVINEVLTNTKNKLDDITIKTNTLEFEDSRGLSELKTLAKKRVIKFVGESSSPDYILFFRPYIRNLYNKLSDDLANGKRIGKIQLEDLEVAKTLASRWSPTAKLTDNIIKNLIKKSDKHLLSDVQEKALDIYLENKGGIGIAI